jgi:hypothetical protein
MRDSRGLTLLRTRAWRANRTLRMNPVLGRASDGACASPELEFLLMLLAGLWLGAAPIASFKLSTRGRSSIRTRRARV